MARTRASVVLPTPRGPHRRYPCATLPLAMAPRSVFETCDWTATSAKLFGRYLRASARDIARREYPRPDGATQDTACRCYLRGPDGVSGLSPSGTWGNGNIIALALHYESSISRRSSMAVGPESAIEDKKSPPLESDGLD